MLLFLLVLVMGCHSPTVTPPDGGLACEGACAALQDAGCEEGNPTPDGVPCTTWLCASDSVNSVCIADAGACAAMRACR